MAAHNSDLTTCVSSLRSIMLSHSQLVVTFVFAYSFKHQCSSSMFILNLAFVHWAFFSPWTYRWQSLLQQSKLSLDSCCIYFHVSGQYSIWKDCQFQLYYLSSPQSKGCLWGQQMRHKERHLEVTNMFIYSVSTHRRSLKSQVMNWFIAGCIALNKLQPWRLCKQKRSAASTENSGQGSNLTG